MTTRRVSVESIYDAILDDEWFTELPSALARSYGARSCNILWQPANEPYQVAARCGHFSDENMQMYVDNFVDKDYWALGALSSDRLNQVHNCAEYVPPLEYERTEFYNDWIRQIGDDTYHCMGMMVASTWGTGLIGFHKGRTQADFVESDIQKFSEDGAHLRKMLAIRGRLNAADTVARRAGGVLDTLGFPILTVDADCRLLMSNAAAERLLSDGAIYIARGGRLRLGSLKETQSLEVLVKKAVDRENPEAGAMTIMTTSGWTHQLTIVAMSLDGLMRRNVVILVTPKQSDSSVAARLRALFKLTPAEADTAVAVASGSSTRLIAEMRSVSVQTVRTQLKAIYAKMDCRSRGDMVARITTLPPVNR